MYAQVCVCGSLEGRMSIVICRAGNWTLLACIESHKQVNKTIEMRNCLVQIWNKIRRDIFRVSILIVLFHPYVLVISLSYGTRRFTVSYLWPGYGVLYINTYLTKAVFWEQYQEFLFPKHCTQQPNFLKQSVCLEQCMNESIWNKKTLKSCLCI